MLGVAVLTGGKLYSLAVSLLVVLLFNFFFTEPYYTLFSAPGYLVTFLIMLVAAIVSSTLTRRIKNQAILSARKAYRNTENTCRKPAENFKRARKRKGEFFRWLHAQLGKLLERTVCHFWSGKREARAGTDGNFSGRRAESDWTSGGRLFSGGTGKLPIGFFGTITVTRARRLIPFPEAMSVSGGARERSAAGCGKESF
ncbi:MAG: DUF4118 domain-containing protein [Lacrimispora saccharolytica]